MFKRYIALPYFFFAVFLGGGIVWVWLVIPETKGKTLEEMDAVFGSRAGAEDAMLLDEARREVGLTSLLGGAGGDGIKFGTFGEGKDAMVQMVEHS